nr:TIM-barrel domain-containing protein [Mucilaginibacter yixingensis]
MPGGVKTKFKNYNIEIRYYSDKIVRVIKYPLDSTVHKKSLSVIMVPEKVQLKVTKTSNGISLQSVSVQTKLDLSNGAITFSKPDGTVLLAEKPDGFQLNPIKDVNLNRYQAAQSFVLDTTEAIYGLGQQQNGKMNQRNTKVLLENANTKVCIPYFQSIKGYGLFWDNYSPTDFTDTKTETVFNSHIADLGDYYFMYGGNGDGVVAQMRTLTGQAPMMPFWTFGFSQSRERYKTQDELLDVVKKYRSLHVPLDGIVQDWQYWGADSVWNAMTFDHTTYPTPQQWVNEIHNLHAKLFIVAWPGFGPKTPQYTEFDKNNQLINFHSWPPKAGTKVYDPFNQAARDIYWRYLNKGIFSLGIDAWWLDSTEPDHIDVKPVDFEQPTAMGSFRSIQNAFPLMHVGNVYDHQRATTSDKRVSILARSAFAGSQRYGANTWSGDISSRWDVFTRQVPAALNFTLTGIPYWNADIGGFFARDYEKTGGAKNPKFQELYTRWLEFAAFTPLMRSHGTMVPREIYQFGERGEWPFDAQERFINIRYHLLPYLYSTAWDVTRHSGSIMRALYLDYPNDPQVYDLGSQFLLGRSLLVAPVTAADNKTTSVYLPAGKWFDFWTGQSVVGGSKVEKATPMDIIPLYLKAGTVMPWGPKVEYSTEKKWDQLELRIYPGADGNFTLYEDEGDNYNYEKGKYTEIGFHWNDKARTLTIDQRKGAFTGMLSSRKFNVVIVDANHGAGYENASRFDQTVGYDGKQAVVSFKK